MKGRVLIAGGGTGGHIFPAIAIAQCIRVAFPNLQVAFVGTRYGMEKHLIPAAGYRLHTMPMRGLLGKRLRQKLALLWRLPVSLLISLWLLVKYRPKAVVGVGGYASAPLLMMAWFCRVPVLIQEQNAFPGVANRIGSRFAKLACVGFAESAPRLHCPVRVTGNPIRADFGQAEPWQVKRHVILVLGGSQGAKALNETLPNIFAQELTTESGYRIVHQCGARHVSSVETAYAGSAVPVSIVPFIEDMARAMNEAVVIVSRAGASTIAELKQVRVPALLIPFPGATHDHQTHNARGLAKLGAAWHLAESDLAAAGPAIKEWLTDRAGLVEMAAAYPTDVPDAAALCVEALTELMRRRPVREILKEYQVHV